VIHAAKLARPFDRADILRLFDNTDQFVIALGVAAIRTWVGIGDVVANRAVGNALLDIAKGLGQPIGLFAWSVQKVEGEALRALWSDARQALQLFYQSEQGIRERHGGSLIRA
jgi:hypothetical protein